MNPSHYTTERTKHVCGPHMRDRDGRQLYYSDEGWKAVLKQTAKALKDESKRAHRTFNQVQGMTVTCKRCLIDFSTMNPKRLHCNDCEPIARQEAAKIVRKQTVKRTEPLAKRECPHCHRMFTPSSTRNIVCSSSKCKATAHRQRNNGYERAARAAKLQPTPCKGCGQAFTPASGKQKYCKDDACVKAQQRRRAAESKQRKAEGKVAV